MQSAATRTIAFPTDLGWFAATGHDSILQLVVIGRRTERAALQAVAERYGDLPPEADWHPFLVARLQAHAAGESVDYDDVELDLHELTPFTRRVVAACRRIPWGATRTYGQLAAIAGSPGAARAVGRVMSANRFPLVIPCHRVVPTGGGLGGFSAPHGVRLKSRLIALEAESQPLLASSS